RRQQLGFPPQQAAGVSTQADRNEGKAVREAERRNRTGIERQVDLATVEQVGGRRSLLVTHAAATVERLTSDEAVRQSRGALDRGGDVRVVDDTRVRPH